MACGVCMGINSDRCPVCGKEPRMKECPECKGTCGTHWAVSVEDGSEQEVTAAAWSVLPETRETAIMMRYRWYRGFFEPCQVCGGTGEIEEDDDYGPDPDELYESRREREMEDRIWVR